MNINKLKRAFEEKELLYTLFNKADNFIETNKEKILDWLFDNWQKIKCTLLELFDIIKKLEDFVKDKESPDWTFQIAAFVDLEGDVRSTWPFFIKDFVVSFAQLLKFAESIQPGAYVYCDIHFFFSIKLEVNVVKRLVFNKTTSFFFLGRGSNTIEEDELYVLIKEFYAKPQQQ